MKVAALLLEREPGRTRARATVLLAGLAAVNVATWIWALAAFRSFPQLVGTAALAYSFGLRHAFDADHIAAIDNVTRKLMQEGKRPVGVGLFFSLGHSTIVVALSVAIAIFSAALQDRFDAFKSFGAVAGTLVSATFLFAIALANRFVLASTWRAFARVRSGTADLGEIDPAFGGGLMARIFRRMFRTVESSRAMYPIGLLFGLGFDTAMLGAYGWAFVKPQRKLFYNLSITATSVLVAFLIGGLEVLNLVGDRFGLTGGFWRAIGALNDNFGTLGYALVGVFALAWIVSWGVYRFAGYDSLEPAVLSRFRPIDQRLPA
ncbi:MAG TPA: HoxN/HupN/NixA family nickel/cobalt transporter [Roseiarcus sp.]|nr:HoxN/HupN/NixA family nickel/cobalt transporter [Roseiarcus sp.]